MKFKESTVTTQKEILKRRLGGSFSKKSLLILLHSRMVSAKQVTLSTLLEKK